ncbi:hypothetical protein CBA19CS22_38980 [Caballeronia novacaledonica]|uniref:Uncharacterized protein n=1 Tax=Caballeronia novacaledonica TaxID=1544861 RepID=A0ACB5R6E5_9BURK|nr:hypothetical protein CBA19CS22_38980 [Caballeronia novacaledonica]
MALGKYVGLDVHQETIAVALADTAGEVGYMGEIANTPEAIVKLVTQLKRGTVLGKTAARHTSEQFAEVLTDVVASQPKRREIHVISDSVSSHKTEQLAASLDAHRNVSSHFTPTYSSWLNQVENCFSRIQRDVIARGIFTSVKDLDRKLMHYIREHNENLKPIKWKYDDPSRRIRPVPNQ